MGTNANSVNQQEATSTNVSQAPQQQSYAKDFDDWANSAGSAKWIRLQSEQPTILRFKSGLPSEMRKKEFGKGPVDIAVYMVTTPAEPEIEKEWTVTSKRLALQIKSYFERGFRELEMTKHGQKEKTYYNIVPNIQQQQQRR